MKYFISMPMNGLPDKLIKNVMRDVRHYIDKTTNGEWIDSLIADNFQYPLEYLGESLKRMAKADTVYFVCIDMLDGRFSRRAKLFKWLDARGCSVEFAAAKSYGKECRYLRAIETKDSTFEIKDETVYVSNRYPQVYWSL